MRTMNIGVLRITLHGAQGLRAADRNGKSDPYVAVRFWPCRLSRPLALISSPVADLMVEAHAQAALLDQDHRGVAQPGVGRDGIQ